MHAHICMQIKWNFIFTHLNFFKVFLQCSKYHYTMFSEIILYVQISKALLIEFLLLTNNICMKYNLKL